MKIRTQLILNMVFFSIALLIISASVISTNQQVERLNAQEELAKNIELKANELSYLSNDYLLYHESQQIGRWESQYSSISTDISNLAVDKPDQQALINNINANQQRLKAIFTDIVSKIGNSSQTQSGAFDPAFIQVSWSRIGVQTQGIVSDASRLSQKIRDEEEQLKLTNYLLGIALLGIFGVFLLTNYFLIYRRTLNSISNLQEGTSIIGSGNLDFSIEEKKDDEFGELSHAFNRMTTQLKTVTASKTELEREIIERKRAEEALRESEQRLRRFYESGLVGVIYWNMNGAITDANDKFLEMVGYNREELAAGQIDWANMTPPEYRHLDEHSIAELKATGVNKVPFEKEYICKDGTCIPIIVAGAMLDEARFNGVAFVLDITERKRAEKALKESEQRWATTLASIGDAVISTDIEGRITFMNAEAEALTGWTLAEASTRPVAEVFNIINEYTRKEADNPISRVLQEGIIVGLANHTILVRKDGTEVPIDDSGAPIRDGDGRTTGVVLVFRDITERKQAEEALRSAEAKFRILVEQSLVGTYITQDKKIIYVNPKLAEILGYTQDEIISSKSVSDLIVEEDSDKAIENIRKRLRGEVQSIQHTFRGKRKDGTLIDLEVHGTRTEFDGKTVVIGTALDITERKRAEEMLRKAHDELELRVQERTAELNETNMELEAEIAERRRVEELIREQAALLDKAQDAIGVRDLEHRLIYWNKGAQRLYGWAAEEIIGKNADELLYKEELPNLIEAKRRVIEEGEWNGELGQITKDGKDIIVESRWTLMRDNEEKPISILIINTDITEKKMLEAQLLRAQRMESIGTLAGGIAHDLNNMLTPIMMSLQMFKEKYKDEQSQRLLNILEQNSQRSADLIKQVLSFARGVEGERNPLAVKHIITEIEKISKETFPRNIEIRTDIPKDLYTILGDATQLHQVIMNLCVNARDAMPDGGILNITASNFFIDENYSRMHTEAKIGSYIIIDVSDTGTGIPPKILDRIFEPFFTTKEFGKGTGLGLSTVLAIVKSHGGFINVNSEVGEGTTFGVYLPAIKTEIQNVDEKQPELLIGHGELVLVAEDEDSVREVTISTLEKNGYRVLTASDGVEAISSYAQNMEEIKVILMDMMMPVMDGHASIRAIRRINPEIKIIAVSGLAEKEKLKNVSDSTNAFLPKPYTAEKLLKTVHEVLNAK